MVRIGDAVTKDANLFRLAGGRIAARACDNRIGTWSAAEALRLLAAERHRLSASVAAVSTIQEENGLYGAKMAGYSVRPDIALVVDVTHATDIPDNSRRPSTETSSWAGGPVIGIGSANHPVLIERLRAIASAKGTSTPVRGQSAVLGNGCGRDFCATRRYSDCDDWPSESIYAFPGRSHRPCRSRGAGPACCGVLFRCKEGRDFRGRDRER